MLRPLDRTSSGDRFDAPDTRRDAAPGDDCEEPDVACRGHVRAAAQLHADARDADDADLVAVFFAEERHRAGRDSLLGRPDLGLHRRIAVDLLVDDSLDAIELLARHRLKMYEIEPQPVGRHERARLLDVYAEYRAQRGVEQVCRRVVAARGIADLAVDFGGHNLVAPKASLRDVHSVKSRPR